MSDPVLVIEAEAAATYDLGPEHPFTPLRRALAADLIRAYGGLDAPHVDVRKAPAASDEEIARAHTPDYIAAVRRLGEMEDGASQPEALAWGLASAGDTPAFSGVHAAAAGVAGASAAAARAVASGDARRSFTVGGGLHHALANRAAGFCVYNDCAVAIHALLDAPQRTVGKTQHGPVATAAADGSRCRSDSVRRRRRNVDVTILGGNLAWSGELVGHAATLRMPCRQGGTHFWK